MGDINRPDDEGEKRPARRGRRNDAPDAPPSADVVVPPEGEVPAGELPPSTPPAAAEGTGIAPAAPTAEGTAAASPPPAPKPNVDPWYDGEPPDSQFEQSDDGRPKKQLFEMKRQRALADANKPIEAATEAIWSTEPDKVKARKTIEDAYRTAARRGTADETEGEMWTRYRKAEEKFESAAADMLRSRARAWKEDQKDDKQGSKLRESHLSKWIDTYLHPTTSPRASPDKLQVRAMLRQRQQVKTRLEKTLGEREKARQEAAETTKNWEKAFGRWSAPDKEIAALIASYFDRIDQLNADINTGNNRDQAIFSFWFEVAPVHLQLRDSAVDAATNTPGVDLILSALTDFPNLANNFKSGKDRGDGSLYLIDPGPKDPPDPSPVATKRRDVLASWQKAADTQAKTEADYATRPDAAADLKPRHDKLKDDGWVKGTKEALADPKKP